MISGEEFARRMKKVSQLRAMGIALRRAAMDAYLAGKTPYRPLTDIRSDPEYWRRLQRQLEEQEPEKNR